MEIKCDGKFTVISTDDSFNLARTLESGQCFRWKAQDGGYIGTAMGHTLFAMQKDSLLYLECSPRKAQKIWIPYFALDIDYNAVRREILTCEPKLADAASLADGIHILRQEPWEALCSFVISQNSNIPKIKRSVEILCQSFGDPLSEGGYSFPAAQRLALLAPEQLEHLRCGYRAPYIINAAKAVAGGEISLEELRKVPIDDARKALMNIKGIGKKVADCALLYGFERLDCFPVDRWIDRAMKAYFPEGSPITSHKYAGIAQLYIFYMMISGEKDDQPA